LNIEVKIGIEKAEGTQGFYESITEMMLCGTDDKVPGIKNGGRIAVIEAGLQNQMVQVRAQRLSEQTIYMYSIQINNIDKLKKTLVTFLA